MIADRAVSTVRTFPGRTGGLLRIRTPGSAATLALCPARRHRRSRVPASCPIAGTVESCPGWSSIARRSWRRSRSRRWRWVGCCMPSARAPPASWCGGPRSRCWRRSWRSRSAARSSIEHSLGVDTIALVAMLGALALGEELVGPRDRSDVLRGRVTRGGCLPTGAPRADRARATRSEGRAAAGRRPTGGGPGGPGSGRRCGPGPDRRGRSGRRHRNESRGRRRHEHAERRAAARDLQARHARAQRIGQRGRPVRRPGRPPGERQRVRRARAAGRAGADPACAVRADGRPLRRVLPAGHAPGRGAGLGDQRRSDPRARRGGGRHPVSADPRRADRARVRTLAGRPRRGDRQGSRIDRDARPGPDGPVRQDRDADRRHPGGARDRPRDGIDAGRAAAAGGVGGSSLGARPRRSARRRRQAGGARADDARPMSTRTQARESRALSTATACSSEAVRSWRASAFRPERLHPRALPAREARARPTSWSASTATSPA